MHVATLLPSSIRRAFQLMWGRARALLEDAPLVFFGVIIAVTLVFRVGVGAVREARIPPVVAPTFVTGPEPGVAPSAPTTTATAAATLAPPVPTVEVGAAARVQPFGSKPRVRARKPGR